MVDWPGPTAPNLWHMADGTSLLVSAYPDLFGVLGYRYGGSGASFNLPDVRDRMAVGASTRALGTTGGVATVNLTAAQNGVHTHGNSYNTTTNDVIHGHSGTTDTTGGVHAHTGTTDTTGGQHQHGGTTGGVTAHHSHTFAFVAPITAVGGTTSYATGGGTTTTSIESGDHGHGFSTDVQGAHGHPYTDTPAGAHGHPFTSATTSIAHAHAVTGATDTGGSTSAAHENMPPWMALAKIIKILPSTAASLTALTIIERTR